jgi:hypothetical protein
MLPKSGQHIATLSIVQKRAMQSVKKIRLALGLDDSGAKLHPDTPKSVAAPTPAGIFGALSSHRKAKLNLIDWRSHKKRWAVLWEEVQKSAIVQVRKISPRGKCTTDYGDLKNLVDDYGDLKNLLACTGSYSMPDDTWHAWKSWKKRSTSHSIPIRHFSTKSW